MTYKERYKEFEQYLTSGELGLEERARNWSINYRIVRCKYID